MSAKRRAEACRLLTLQPLDGASETCGCEGGAELL